MTESNQCRVKSCPIEFLQNSIWPRKDYIFGHSESGYNSTELFKIWFENVFLENLTERRSKLDSNTNKWAVLISDGYVGHDAGINPSLIRKFFFHSIKALHQ